MNVTVQRTERSPWWMSEVSALPVRDRAFYEPSASGGFVLRDILNHLMSVDTPLALRPLYEIRQFSHRRASFLKRELIPEPIRTFYPSYPLRLNEYRHREEADALHGDLLYLNGTLCPEFRHLWLSR
jgi:hypothetical protein